jgi:hypothetical protein
MFKYLEYGFETNLTAIIRVPARNEHEARALLSQTFENVDGQFGIWPDGQPIIAEACALISREELFEINGEEVCPPLRHWRFEQRAFGRIYVRQR